MERQSRVVFWKDPRIRAGDSGDKLWRSLNSPRPSATGERATTLLLGVLPLGYLRLQ